MMKSRLRLTTAVLLLPLLVVLGSAALLLREDGERVRSRAAAVLNSLLQDMVMRYEEAEASWADRLEAFAAPLLADHRPETLRAALEREPLVRTIAVLDPKGSLVFPDPAAPSLREQEFLQRSAALLEEPWLPAMPENGRYAELGRWQRFYWREGVQLLYWKPLPDSGGFLLLEIERSALMADLVWHLGGAPLPGSSPSGASPSGASPSGASPSGGGGSPHSVRLADELGRVFLSWGRAEPGGAETTDAPVVSRVALSGALQGWQFSWSAPLSAVPGTADTRLFLGLFLGVAAAASAALALTLLRRLDRDIREAGQRVSFVNQVSHELKTPLTNIRLYAELLEERFAGADPGSQEARYLGIILRESARLGRLIHNVLTFARQKNGVGNGNPGSTHILHPRPLCPDTLVLSCLEGFKVSFAEKGMEVELDLHSPGELDLDGDVFEQILGNLLSNAEKYARQGGWVGISTAGEKDAVRVEVCDRGPGLPSQASVRAFQPFERFHTRHTDGVGGAGLGLAIARDLARRHGGDAGYQARAGGGACFHFILRSIPATEVPA
jgi:signal transduction histidine kinase